METGKRKILMVCLGNVCRSPIAEAVMEDVIRKAGLSELWEVDSAAIVDIHKGNSPDSRAQRIMQKYNLPYTKYSRQVLTEDFNRFDYVFGMDEDNVEDLHTMAPDGCKAKIFLLGAFGLDKSNCNIVDPYYEDGSLGFEKAYQQSLIACDTFFKAVLANNV